MALTEKGLKTMQSWCAEMGPIQCGVKMVNYHLTKLTMGISSDDLPDTATFSNGLDAIEEHLNDKNYQGAWDEAKYTAREMLEDEGFFGMFENKEKIKENKKMKRITYKKELPTINEALKLIPDEVKVDNQLIEMVDGNKKYKVRWEGTLEEGRAVELASEDKKLVSEDISKMKRLWGYKSENTTGIPSSKNRVNENEKFKNLLTTVKKTIND